VTWLKPAHPQAKYYANGFTNQVGALASAYVPPTGRSGRLLPLANGSVVFSGGNLAANFTNSVTIGPLGRVSNLSGGGLSVTISPSTGIFRGSVVDPYSNLRFPINGVVLQNLNAGFGLLLGTNQSSRVLIAPSE
jgi:hypothetical protein